MLEQDVILRLAAAVEEELGSFRAFADLPATELEAMAARIVGALGPYLDGRTLPERRNAA